jgi:hypothetical protein
MIQVSIEAQDYVRATYPASFAEELLSQDGFRLHRQPTPGAERIFEDLVGRGHMRRSTRGRYWWTGR